MSTIISTQDNESITGVQARVIHQFALGGGSGIFPNAHSLYELTINALSPSQLIIGSGMAVASGTLVEDVENTTLSVGVDGEYYVVIDVNLAPSVNNATIKLISVEQTLILNDLVANRVGQHQLNIGTIVVESGVITEINQGYELYLQSALAFKTVDAWNGALYMGYNQSIALNLECPAYGIFDVTYHFSKFHDNEITVENCYTYTIKNTEYTADGFYGVQYIPMPKGTNGEHGEYQLNIDSIPNEPYKLVINGNTPPTIENKSFVLSRVFYTYAVTRTPRAYQGATL